MPTFANPSGRIMSPRRRRELVLLARKYDVLVICDDVYDMLLWRNPIYERPANLQSEGDPCYRVGWRACIPRIVDIDRAETSAPAGHKYGNSCSNGSFSKLVGPGLRTGWLEGTEAFVENLSLA